MKKLAIIFSLFALLVGCEQYGDLDQIGQNNDVENGGAQGGELPTTLSASIESEETRAFVGDDNVSVLWHNGDAVSYFGEKANAKYVYNGEDGASEATMELVSEGTEGAIEGDYTYAVYPYAEGMTATTTEGGYNFNVTYPATQTYAEGSFGKGANVMVAAKANGSEGHIFRHTGGYLVLKLYGEGVNVKTITLSALNSEVKLAGDATVTALGSAEPTVKMGAEATSVVTLNCGSGVALGATAETATEFWFALPAVNIEGGLKITVTATDNRTFEKQTTNTVNIERGKVQPMAALKFECNVTTPYQLFYTTSNGVKLDIEGLGLDPFDAEIASHTYENGQGVFTFKTPLTAIKDYAFGSFTSYVSVPIESITIPESVTTIGNEAFNYSDLKDITIPGTVNTIGLTVFGGGGKHLKSITFLPSPTNTPLTLGCYYNPKSKRDYGALSAAKPEIVNLNRELILLTKNGTEYNPLSEFDGLFMDDDGGMNYHSLTVTLGEQVTTIHDSMFLGTPITEITIPASVTVIEEDAFFGCENLTSVTFESSSEDLKIGPSISLSTYYGPFYDTTLETLVLDRNLVPTYTIDYDRKGLFSELSTLKNVTLGPNVKTISNRMFLETGITSITIPNSVTAIDDYAFYNCQSLKNVTIGNSVQTIGMEAFRDTIISSITIPGSVTNIGVGAFRNTNISLLTIPASVTKIDQYAFYDCEELIGITFDSGTNDLVIVENGNGPFYQSQLLEIYLDRELVYQDVDGNAFVADSSSEGIFANNHDYLVTSGIVALGPNVKTIHNYMFNYLPIRSLTIGENVKTIGVEAFRDTNITSLTIPGSVTKIGVDAFYNCESLSTVTFEPSDTETPLKIGQGFTSGGSDLGPFYYSPLSTINLNRELQYIDKNGNNFAPDWWDEGVFTNFKYNDSSFTTSIEIGWQVKTILPYMFSHTRVNSIWIPNNVTSIGNYAFYGCSAFNGMSCNHTTPPTLGKYTFLSCNAMWYIVVPAEAMSKFKSANNWSAYNKNNSKGENFYYTL